MSTLCLWFLTERHLTVWNGRQVRLSNDWPHKSINQEPESESVMSAHPEREHGNERQNKVKQSTVYVEMEGRQSGVAIHHAGCQVGYKKRTYDRQFEAHLKITFGKSQNLEVGWICRLLETPGGGTFKSWKVAMRKVDVLHFLFLSSAITITCEWMSFADILSCHMDLIHTNVMSLCLHELNISWIPCALMAFDI